MVQPVKSRPLKSDVQVSLWGEPGEGAKQPGNMVNAQRSIEEAATEMLEEILLVVRLAILLSPYACEEQWS